MKKIKFALLAVCVFGVLWFSLAWIYSVVFHSGSYAVAMDVIPTLLLVFFGAYAFSHLSDKK